MITFGPVPSRRLGRSLGINNIPSKTCSYSCSYCQIGYTNRQEINRFSFYEPFELVKSIKSKLQKLKSLNEHIDYITFVPDGEPTLDINLDKELSLLKDNDINVAVITNSSLLWDKAVRQALMPADCISIKVDAANEEFGIL